MTTARTTSPPLAYLQIKRRLLHRLDTQWSPGDRLPAMPDLARSLDAGQTNTHRAVQALVREGRLISRRGAGTFVAPVEGRLPDTTHRHEPALAGRRIAIVSTPRPIAMIETIADAATSLLVGHGAEVVRTSRWLSGTNSCVPADVDAAIVINPDPQPALHFGEHQRLAVVSTRDDIAIAASAGYDIVLIDQEQGGYLAGAFARRVGCKRPCFVGVHHDEFEPFDCTSMSRLRGFQRGFGAIVPRRHLIQRKCYGQENGAVALAQYLRIEPRPDVVFCASDELAVGFALGAASHDLKPGRDFRLIGFDRQQSGRELADRTLTTVDAPACEMGGRVADMLATRLANPDQPVRRLAIGCAFVRGDT